ncbi:MAG: glutamine--tRNA ligase/YqeY domain fusion protein [Phycisphaerales bacterium]
MSTVEEAPKDFIRQAIDEHLEAGRFDGVVTRFPPEPNGYLHIGHAKAIHISFTIAGDYNGRCHLRFDDTNPVREEQKYIDAMREDIRWLGFEWGEHEYFASDYFEQLYDWAVELIKKGVAYVDDQDADTIRETRGTLTKPGAPSPFRSRTVDENLDLFARMGAGEFPNGSKVLRAKIDMASPNMNLRDPVMYRIQHAHHHRTGDAWKIYPMYDWAHGQSDSIEGITHSLCSLEFEDHRPLYDWFVDQLGIHHPQQIEFARLNLSHTITSKRKLLQLVTEGHVAGWDDPRMPTLAAMRRRGYPPAALRAFIDRVGIAKRSNVIELSLLEHFVRDELNRTAPRVMGVLNPLKVVITNYPEDQVEELDAINNPEDPAAGSRKVPFARELWIERDDFMEDPPRKFFRLGPGREVRLRYAYFVTCTEVVKDDAGEIVELRCEYDPATRGGDAPDGRKVKGTLHWVAAPTALDAEVRLYETLFSKADPEEVESENEDYLSNLNPDSLKIVPNAKLEPSVTDASPGTVYQFERLGYFCVDPDSTEGAPVFNRTSTLRDTWSKIAKSGGK